MEHVMMVCKAYEREQKILKEELQLLGIQEFTINKILSDGPNAGKKINAIMKFIRISGLKNSIEKVHSLHTPSQ